jgi:hypothetical protein
MRGSVIQRSRRLGVLCTLLWLLGIELLPAAHLAGHRADHTHGADGSIVADHEHDATGHDVLHHDDLDLDHTGRLVLDHPSHAAAGFAHHAIALQTPPPPPALVAATVAAPHRTLPALASPPAAPEVRPTARGPPGGSRSTVLRA